MAGIYIHFPFCKSKCYYCNFYSVASSKHLGEYITALLKEIGLQKKYIGDEDVETIYFGGGTPSLMHYNSLMQIFDQLQLTFEISKNAEITIEANPDDVDIIKLRDLRKTPVNRISIGIQSFFDEDLKYLNRKHSSLQAEASVKRSQDAGYENISVDLIYGIPSLTDDKWKKNLERSFSLAAPHVSAYGLTVETKTALETLIRKGKAKPADDGQTAGQFRILMEQMRSNNFIHYEISNFCKEGNISRHNSNYWKGIKYLGLGASAHSFNIISRQWNSPDIINYLANIAEGEIPFEKEILSETDKLNEYVMTSLRTMWGCDLSYVENNFGTETKKRIENRAKKYQEKELMIINKNTLHLTDEGILFADGISSDFFE